MKSLHSWNSRRAEAEGVILLPRHWKSDAVPLLNSDGPQSVIDSQLVDDADIVIAVFDSRLGTGTPDAVSGTAHEIERTAQAGKPVHVYFSDEPVSRNADPEELARLNAFRAEMEANNLLGVYVDPRGSTLTCI
jgi:nucleoside 2-deoxyribosyltransferase